MNEKKLSTIPQGWPMVVYTPSRNRIEGQARLRHWIAGWARMTGETAYRCGKELIINKARIGHGGFIPWLIEIGIKKRTAERLMEHARECDQLNRILPYHPNRKSDTVTLLDPPEIQDKSELGIKKPRHESEPLAWSAAEAAEKIFEFFEKLTRNRKIEEMEDVATQVEERIRDYIESRREDRLMIRGGREDNLGIEE